MGRSILAGIDSPASLKKLSTREAEALAEEIRKIIVETVSHNGGHLSSNLGVIELTIALHMVFSSPEDAIVWDVGHQCYAHKLLTGRAARFSTIRKKGGLSGFPRRDESPHDVFGTGHASTSISAAYGILTARRMQGSSGKVVAVIGDGALTGGMAYEALSHAGENKKDLIVILNDNKMSIGKNTGALSEYLSRLSMRRRYQRLKLHTERFVRAIPLVGGKLYRLISKLKSGLKTFLLNDNFFMDLGFEYVGPLNGHKIEELRKVLIPRLQPDHTVGPEDNVAAKLLCLLDKPFQVRAHLRCPACDIYGIVAMALIHSETGLKHISAHDLRPVGSAFQMAVLAGQIALPSHIDLKHGGLFHRILVCLRADLLEGRKAFYLFTQIFH